MGFINDIFYAEPGFRMFGMEHLISVIIAVLIGTTVIAYAHKQKEKRQDQIMKLIAVYLSSVIVGWAIIEMVLGRFEIAKDLPLVFCNFIALLLPIYAFNRKSIMFNMIYYVVIGGAIQAIITPGLKMSFPHYEYIKFWSVHSGLIIFILYDIIIFKRRPSFKGVFWAFLFVQAHVVFSFLLNLVLDSNYLFLNAKPDNASFLDLLGGWPQYIFVMDLILIPYFLIFYLPFFIADKLKKEDQNELISS